MKLGLLYSRVRFEEKRIVEALCKRGIDHELIDDREIIFNLTPPIANGHVDGNAHVLVPERFKFDVVLDRALEFTRGVYALQILNSWHIRTVNPAAVVATCGDKLLTTAALTQAKILSPETRIAFTPDAALEAIEVLGYPVVIKPVIGSWGRLVAKLNDREIVVGDEIVAAIYRQSAHWITNTARGARATPCPMDHALEKLVRDAARAVGGGILAIDVIEDPTRGYLVNEINPTPEFRGAETATHADIPNKIIDYVLQVAA